MNIQVLNNEGELEEFNSSKIRQKIIEETGLEKKEVDKITNSVLNIIKKNYEEEISTSSIRSLINSQLIKRGLHNEELKSRKLGLSVAEFEHLINEHCKDNANISFCLSKDNKVLIKDKKENIKLVKISEIPKLIVEEDYFVPSINIETNIISWKKILNAKKTGYKEVFLIKFGKGHSIEVTDNHNLLRVTNDKQGYRIAKRKPKISLQECISKNNFRHIAKINSIPNDDDENIYYESALFGFFLGDGTIVNEQGLVRFGFRKKDKVDYLTDLLDKLGLDYSVNTWKNGVVCVNIPDLYPKQSKLGLIKEYTHFNSLGVIEGLINSDGCVYLIKNNLSLSFTSKDKEILDLLYVCLLMNNVTSNYYDKEYSTLTVKSVNLDKLLSKITLRQSFLEKYNNSHFNTTREFKELSETTIKEYIPQGKKDVYNLTIEDNHNYLAGITGLMPVSNSPESVAKYTYDATAKQYALLTMPKDCADAHIKGYFHIHDLEYYNTRPNCFTMSLDWVARNGVVVDGIGESGSVAGSPKSLEVLVNHALQTWMALATVLSGGVGFNNFNTYLAPFCRGRSYEDIKQAIQSFIFNCNMSLIARGGQVLFSSIGVDLSIPDVLKDEPAISVGGVPMGVYGDYQEEANLVFRAICEVIDEKDYLNRPHRFPNVLFNIRDGDLDEYVGNCKLLHEMAVNNPQVYFNNCKSLERSTMGCRSSLPMNYTGDYKKDCTNCGNFMYNTINLPLLALESENLDEFYEKLDYYCELTYKSLHHRKEQIEKILYDVKMSNFLTQKDKDTGESLYDLQRNTFTIGYCGLNEALIVLTGQDIIEEVDLGVEIIEFINKKKDEFHLRDGLRWSVIASPAESTAHRFAEIIKQKYPDAPVQGKKDYYYLTNSSHIAVKDNSMFANHVRNADKFHQLSLGGNILHLWLGEVWSDPEAYWSLNKKILETNTIFWAYSKCYTFCKECQFTINDKLTVCPICGSTDLQVWDRITGYFVPCSNYNKGKLQEFEERYRHKMSKEE